MSLKLLLCSLFVSNILLANTQIVNRAAIDFGSGAVKLNVSCVDVEKNQVVGDPLVIEYTVLLLTEDVAKNGGYISPEMEAKALAILLDYKGKALSYVPEGPDFTGIATAIFRKAKNGQECLDRLEEKTSIPFQILSQEDEGRLGFLTALAVSPEVSEQNLLAWDSGNSSFQLSAKVDDQIQVYQGPLGHGTLKVLLSQQIRNETVLQSSETGCPISQDEYNQLSAKIREHLLPAPNWLKDKVQNGTIVCFGDFESIFAVTSTALKTSNFTKDQVKALIDLCLNKTDDEIKALGFHRKTVTSAILLYTVMDHFQMQQVIYKKCLGTTPGMLIYPSLWL